MKAKGFDRKFDKGEDVTQSLDMSQAQRPAQEQRRVNVDFRAWMIDFLDREAKRLGVTRQCSSGLDCRTDCEGQRDTNVDNKIAVL